MLTLFLLVVCSNRATDRLHRRKNKYGKPNEHWIKLKKKTFIICVIDRIYSPCTLLKLLICCHWTFRCVVCRVHGKPVKCLCKIMSWGDFCVKFTLRSLIFIVITCSLVFCVFFTRCAKYFCGCFAFVLAKTMGRSLPYMGYAHFFGIVFVEKGSIWHLIYTISRIEVLIWLIKTEKFVQNIKKTTRTFRFCI